MFKILASISICLVVTSNTWASVIQIDNLNIALQEIRRGGKSTVVILDVDDVLITPQDHILRSSDLEARTLLGVLNTQLRKRLTEAEMQHLWSIILSSRQVKIVDVDTLKFVQQASKYANRVFCLTTSGVGKFGKIESLAEWRIAELKGIGFQFNNSYPIVDSVDLDPLLATKDPICKPMYKDGILFSCNLNKGDVLKAYFAHQGIRPKHIIFIDDSLKNIRSVEQYCKNNGIEYHGFEYTAAKKHNSKKFDPKLAEMQFNILEKENKWLNDSEVENYLKVGSSNK